MSTATVPAEHAVHQTAAERAHLHEKMSKGPGKLGGLIFGRRTHRRHRLHRLQYRPRPRRPATRHRRYGPTSCSASPLLVALGFEFVNGFHDTANAVATVIYTHSLEPHIAVVWSGFWNFARRRHLHRRGRLRHRLAAARRTDPAGRQRRRLRHGLRPADRRHPLEPRHLVVRSARLPARTP